MTKTLLPSLADRRLHLSGAVNFRDIGGYLTTDLRREKKRLAYRSDHLSRLTTQDQQLLQDLRFKAICDLRTIREQQAPDLLPGDGSIRLLLLPVRADGFDPATAMGRLRAGDDSWLSIEDYLIRKAGLDRTTLMALQTRLLQ